MTSTCEDSIEDVAVPAAPGSADEDYYSVLIRMVAAVSQDHSQLRMLVYEVARRKLRRNLFQQFEDGDWLNIVDQMRALEAAINRVEFDCAQKALTFNSEPPLTYPEAILGSHPHSQTAVTVAGHAVPTDRLFRPLDDVRNPFQPQTVSTVEHFVAAPNGRSRSAFWRNVQLIVAVLLGAVIYAAADGQSALSLLKSHRLGEPVKIAAGNGANADGDAGRKNASSVRSASPGIPTPSAYGVYALSDGKLTELESLSMRVPDPRVAISPLITKPCRAHVQAGKLQFVAFLRDLANNAPDRVAIRVVAQVKRALTFDSVGKAAITPVNDAWVVRSNSYQMRVAPVSDNPEMIIITSEPSDIMLPAGRYALVLKASAYDFTIDGLQTDAAHCLERTDALNAPVYTECRDL